MIADTFNQKKQKGQLFCYPWSTTVGANTCAYLLRNSHTQMYIVVFSQSVIIHEIWRGKTNSNKMQITLDVLMFLDTSESENMICLQSITINQITITGIGQVSVIT